VLTVLLLKFQRGEIARGNLRITISSRIAVRLGEREKKLENADRLAKNIFTFL
jgi:hypothetical protein